MPYGNYQSLPLSTKLSAMLEATQAGTWEWNVQTGECHFNERWAEIMGYRLDELEPVDINTWLASVHPDDGERSERLLKQHFSGQQSFYECEARVKHKQGHWVWVRDYGRVVSHTADGKPEWMVGTHIDISALVTLSERFSAFSDLLPGVVYQYLQGADGSGSFPYASEGLKQVYGVAPDDVKEDASAVFEAIHPDDLDRVSETIQQSAAEGTDWICEYRVLPHGEERWVLGHARPRNMGHGMTAWYGMIVDITERKQLEIKLAKSQANLKLAQKIARTGHWEANTESGKLYWSDMVYQILGLSRAGTEVSVDFFRSLVPEADLPIVLASEKRAQTTGTHDVQHRMRKANGDIIWIHELAELQADKVTLIGTVRDITQQKELELKLKQQATLDPLTGLFNRRHFQYLLDQEYQRFRRYRAPFSLVAFDLDHFKRINDTYGHAMGDEVLKQLATTVSEHLRSNDACARVGGEEFTILLADTRLQEAEHVAEKVRQAVAAMKVELDGKQVTITATFGVIAMASDIESEKQLQQIADRALYRGKELGRNRVVVADHSLYEIQ